jgi:hypothetical protein
MDLGGIGCEDVDRMQLAQDRVLWSTVGNTVMNVKNAFPPHYTSQITLFSKVYPMVPYQKSRVRSDPPSVILE